MAKLTLRMTLLLMLLAVSSFGLSARQEPEKLVATNQSASNPQAEDAAKQPSSTDAKNCK